MLSHLASFIPFYEVIPEIFRIFANKWNKISIFHDLRKLFSFKMKITKNDYGKNFSHR